MGLAAPHSPAGCCCLLPAACLWLQRSSWLRCRLSLPQSTHVGGAWEQQCTCYTTVPPGELAWFGDDNKPCEQSSLHYSSKTQGSAESPALTLASILAGSHAFPRAGSQALTHSLFHLANSSQSTVLCPDSDFASTAEKEGGGVYWGLSEPLGEGVTQTM